MLHNYRGRHAPLRAVRAMSRRASGRYEVVMRIGGNDSSYDVSSPAYFGLR